MNESPQIKYLAPTKISRERANEILDAWKAGAQPFPSHVVNLALLTTGDIQTGRVQQREWLAR